MKELAPTKLSKNHWHKTMYTKAFANQSIGSKRFIQLAATQVEFLDSVLDLPPKAKILDIPCGVGRHALLFGRKGYQVTGVDISKECLKIAKQKFANKNVKYKLGDMSNLKTFKGQYDCALNLFTSFGYFHTDKENEKVLKEMYRALKPGGKVVLNLIDRDFVLKVYDPAMWHNENGILVMESCRYDKKTKYSESHITIINQRKKKPEMLHHHYHRVRLYSKPEMVTLLKRTGFKKIQIFDGYSGGKYRKGKSTHPIYIGTKSR